MGFKLILLHIYQFFLELQVPEEDRRILDAKAVEVMFEAVANKDPGLAALRPNLPYRFSIAQYVLDPSLCLLDGHRIPQVLRPYTRTLIPEK